MAEPPQFLAIDRLSRLRPPSNYSDAPDGRFALSTAFSHRARNRRTPATATAREVTGMLMRERELELGEIDPPRAGARMWASASASAVLLEEAGRLLDHDHGR